jgi:hypothetical protein
MPDMATREQLHAEIDAVPDGRLADARVVVDDSQNGDRPYLGLSDAERKRQQESLREFADELEAEGIKPDKKHVDELKRRAATWPV